MSTVSLLTSTNIQGTDAKEFSYPSGINGSALLSAAVENLGLPSNIQYVALCYRKGTTLTFVDPKKNIIHYHLQDGTMLYVLKVKQILSIQTTSGQKKKLVVDITLTVGELVKFFAEKLRIGHAVGYSLYTIDTKDGAEVYNPLDLDMQLPIQSPNYENLLFKRRYYYFLKSHIQEKQEALFVFNDVKTHIDTSRIKIEHDDAFLLAYYAIYALANAPEEVTPATVPKDLSSVFPSQTPPQSDDYQKMVEKITNGKQLSRQEAVCEYLTLAHKIPYFACEIFKTKFSLKGEKTRQDGTVVVNPKSFSLITSTNEMLYNVPWFRVKSYKEHKGTVLVKFLERRGSEVELSLKVKKSNDLKTLMSGYSSIDRELGSYLMTDGFLQEDALTEKVEASYFNAFITPDENALYAYFPGTTEEFEKVMNRISDITSFMPQVADVLKKSKEALANDPGDMMARLDIIRALGTMLKSGNASDFCDPNAVELAMCTVSTINITPGAVRAIASSLEDLIEQQKLIRAETMTKVESARKQQLSQWLKALKDHRQKLSELLIPLDECPSHGQTVMLVRSELIQLLSDIKDLQSFIESIINLSPDSSYLPAIEHFVSVIKEALVPMLPHQASNRLKHIYSIHKMLFYVGLTLALFKRAIMLGDIAGNAELLDSIKTGTNTLVILFNRANEARIDLLKRPFNIKLRQKMLELLAELKRSLLQLKSQGDMITDILGENIVAASITFATNSLTDDVAPLNNLHTEPYRHIPDAESVTKVYQMCFDISGKIGQVDLMSNADLKDQLMYVNKNLLTITSELSKKKDKPDRSVIPAITMLNTTIKDLMKCIQEIAKSLNDASIVHLFNGLLMSCSKELAPVDPTFAEFRGLIDTMIKEAKDLANKEAIGKDLLTLLTKCQDTIDIEEQEDYIEGMVLWSRRALETGETEEKSIAIESINQLFDCVLQLPLREYVQPTPLLIFPFFQGKEAFKMTSEFVIQVGDLARFISDFLKAPLFAKNESLANLIRHWDNYFEVFSGQLDGLQQHESTLVSRLREISRKAPHVRIFAKMLAPHLTDSKFIEMIDVFFNNCDMIISKLLEPHISNRLVTRFTETVVPLLQQTEIALSRSISSSTPDQKAATDRLKNIRQLITTRLGDAQSNDPSKQQELADKLYGAIGQNIPYIRQDAAFASISQMLVQLRSSLTDYTAVSMKNPFSMSSSAISTTLTTEVVEDVLTDFVEGGNKLTDLLMRTFRAVVSMPEVLPAVSSYAANVLKAAGAEDIKEDALRFLVFTQEQREAKITQFKRLAIHYSVKAAQLIAKLKQDFNAAKKGSTPQAAFYRAYLASALDNIDPTVLLNSPSFPSVALTFSALRDVRTLCPLFLSEEEAPELKKTATAYSQLLSEADHALMLYFYVNSEAFVQAVDELTAIDEACAKAAGTLEDAKKALSHNSLIVSQNYVILAKAVSSVQACENAISGRLHELAGENPPAKNALKALAALKEIRFIMQQWEHPMAEFTAEEFRIQALSSLSQAALLNSSVEAALKNGVMRVPFYTSRLFTQLSFGIELASQQSSQIGSIAQLINKVAEEAATIDSCNANLFNDNLAYKADIQLQRALPSLIDQVDGLITAVIAYKEPDYTKVPTSIRRASPRQCEIVTATMEHTEFYEVTKEICDEVTAQLQKSPGDAKARLLTSVVETLPTYTIISEEEGMAALNESLAAAIATPSQLQTLLPKIVASFVRVFPSISKQTVDRLAFNPTKLMKATLASGGNVPECILVLQQYLKYMEMAPADLKKESTSATVSVIQVLDTNDPVKISSIMQSILALKAVFEDKQEQAHSLDEIVSEYSAIQKEISESVASGKAINASSVQAINKMKVALIKIITTEAMKLTIDIDSAKTISDLIDIRTTHHLSARALISQSVPEDEAARSQLLLIASNMAILTYRGLNVIKDAPRSFFRDFISLFDSSIRTFSGVIAKDGDQKKALRIFRRVVDNMGDMCDDLSLEIEAKPLEGFEADIRTFLVASTCLMSTIAHINSAYASAEITQSFAIVQEETKATLLELVQKITEEGRKLCSRNKVEGIVFLFTSAVDALKDLVEKLASTASTVSLSDWVALQLPITQRLEQAAATAIQMTDVVQLKLDMVSSALLPAKIKMPPVPVLEEGVTLKSLQERLEASHGALSKAIDALAPATELASENQMLLERTQAFIAAANEYTVSMLAVSVKSLSLQAQSDLTSAAIIATKTVDGFNSAARSKFLAVPTCIEEMSAALDEVRKMLAETNAIADGAVSEALREESSRDARAQQFIDALKPVSAAEARAKEILKKESGNPMAVSLVELCSTAAALIASVIIKEKDRKDADPKKVAEAAKAIADRINRACESIDAKPLDIASAADDFGNSLKSFAAAVPESGADVVSSITKLAENARTLKSTIERTVKGGSRPGRAQDPAAVEKYMKRLLLEAKVLKSRWWLEYGEKKMTELN